MSPAGRTARLSILIFHRVLREPDPIFPGEVDARRFDLICRWVRSWHNVLSLDEAVRRLQQGDLPARALSITFDDGYADNHDVALPILQRHGLSATFFIATGFLNGGRMWNDTVVEAIRHSTARLLDLGDLGLPGIEIFALGSWAEKRAAIQQILPLIKYLPVPDRLQLVHQLGHIAKVALPEDLMMTSAQVVAMHRAGMGIGGHTVNHPILAGIDDEAASHEIQSGRHYLQSLTQTPVGLLAYPNGRPGTDYTARTVQLARRLGFEAAVSTAPGTAHQGADLLQLPRFTPWDAEGWRFGLRLARNLRTPVATVS